MKKYFIKEPPSNNCIAIINGKNVMKKPDENWKTADPCLSESCAFDTNGNPIIKPVRKTCNNICVAVSSLKYYLIKKSSSIILF